MSSNMTAAQQWHDALGQWAIPDEILAQAPTSPWVHPPAMFKVDPETEIADTPSKRVAREALLELPSGAGSVLDVGCGGGGSSIGLAPFATELIGVDEQAAMLTNFETACRHVGVACRTVVGRWPDVADATPQVDVVVCHHVVYNVADIAPFVRALTNHARHRVVVELPQTHPTSPFSPLWRQFWNLDRPSNPTSHDFVAVVRELGYEPTVERFRRTPRKASLDHADYVAFVRTRLCLPADRDGDVAAALANMDTLSNDELVTVWWK
jgi:SAM-dependent methyltransferase